MSKWFINYCEKILKKLVKSHRMLEQQSMSANSSSASANTTSRTSQQSEKSLIDSGDVEGSLPPTCNSEIYCHGKLLHTVQMMRIFEDSKTFVDLKMKVAPKDVLRNFNQLLNKTSSNPDRKDVKTFLEDNFESGNELEDWFPPDFVVEPKLIDKVKDVPLKCFTRELVALWPFLARKISSAVLDNPSMYSLVPLRNGFIIPGGRFKETYYWDTYWIIKGLLISEMYETARGMLDNLLALVRDYGFVPNGARVYYLQRSQPPLLTAAAYQYVRFTNDTAWLKDNIEMLEKELNFWLKERTVQILMDGEDFMLAHYNAASSGPRPESYLEDMLVTQNLSEIDREKTFIEIKSGAESGWDFSSRWFVSDNGDNNASMSKISTRQIIPVDLNAILCGAFKLMASFFARLENPSREKFWLKYAELWQKSIDRVLWSDTDGIWYDYDNQLKKHRNYFYISNITPLWTQSIGSDRIRTKAKQSVIAYLEKSKVFDYPGGIPTSLLNTGQQWDAPNAWAPLQSILIKSLENLNTEKGSELALKLANKWIDANWIGFRETNEMFEKYNSEDPGKYGNGGEYIVQAGFGWTNGVALELINRYPQQLQLH